MSGKRWLSFFLLAVLTAGLLILPGAADDLIIFTAVNNTLLELTEETMPVSHNSMIYVPCSVFNTRALDTWAYYSRGTQTVLISDGSKELTFDMSAGNSYDRDGEIYPYAAIYANDTAYVPAFYVADFFGLGYSYIRRDERYIIRITKGDVLSDEDFFNAAASLMEARLIQYQGVQETPEPTPEPTPTPVPPTPTPSSNRNDVAVHLCFLGLGEQSAAILEALDGTPACFFATAAEVYARADLVRRILGSGCTLGLRITEDPAAEREEFRRALRDTAMCVSYLAAGTGLTEETAAAAENCGLCLLAAEEELRSAGDCAGLLAGAEKRCDLLLAGDFGETAALLRLLLRDHYTLEAVTEVTGGR